MWVVSDVTAAREAMAPIKAKTGFVPTMGALHAGHLSLIEKAKAAHEHVVVSIFVNPAQFAPHEDLSRYPRPIERDLEMCEKAGVAGVFHPTVEAMYPPGLPPCEVSVPAMAADLEGAIRPGHFAGVCRVVAKLFNIIQPVAAYFGEKDLQQLLVIEAMVADLNMPVRIVPCPTLREADGLAMSSRNVYLSATARKHALGLSKALHEARQLVTAGETDASAVEAAMRQVMAAHHVQVDYAVVRHAHNLQSVACIEPAANKGMAALVAGRVENVRLIDNTRL